jgi:tetratricopeptide (TPR) repeat protein
MIVNSEWSEVKGTTPPSRYRVEVPATNPLMPSAAVSLVKEGDQISLKWDHSETVDAEGIAQRLVSESLNSARVQVNRYPKSARAHTNLGLACANAGNLSDAVSAFQEALKLDPDSYVASTHLAKVFASQVRLDEAEEIYRRLCVAFPGNVTPLMGLAYLAMRRDNFIEAEKLFRDVVGRRPATPVPFYHLAVLLLHRRETGEAIKLLRTALRHNVRSAALYQAIGVAYALAGDNERSARAFRTALTLSPNLDEALKGLANTLLRVEQTDAAIDLLSGYVDRSPEDGDARLSLAKAYLSKQRYAAARGQFMHVLESCSHSPEATGRCCELSNDIGFTYYAERQLKDAENWFRKALRCSRDHGTLPYRNLARLYADQQRYKDALGALRDCSEVFGDDEYTATSRGLLYADAGEYDRALAEFESVVSRGTNRPDAYLGLTWLLADTKHDYKRALDLLRSVSDKFPNTVMLVNNMAYMHLMLGDTQSARVLLEHTRFDTPNTEQNVALTATKGLLRLKEGDHEKARELYQSAARLASQIGNRRLADTVRQKMHLEFAREALQNGRVSDAAHEINAGLKADKGRPDYNSDLIQLRRKLPEKAGGWPTHAANETS